MKAQKILIAEGYPMLAKSILKLLENKGLQICAVCNDNVDAYNKIVALKPAVAILDINTNRMNAVKIMEKLTANNYHVDTIVITAHNGSALYKRARELGAKGYLLKTCPVNEFEKCIDEVVKGGSYFSEELTNSHYLKQEETDYGKLMHLSELEIKILERLSDQKTTKQIAQELFLSVKTIENYRSKITKKLGLLPVQNSLMLWAIEHRVMIGEF